MNANKFKKSKIALIGDGLGAAIILDQITRKHHLTDCELSVDVFALSEDIGRGKAYSKKTPLSMFLNQSVQDMRYGDEDGRQFLDYLRGHGYPYATEHSFEPRKVFGDFIEDETKTILADYQHAISVRFEPVQNIEASGDAFTVNIVIARTFPKAST